VFKLSGRQVETGKKQIFLVKKSKKYQKTAISGQKTIKNENSDLATRKFEVCVFPQSSADIFVQTNTWGINYCDNIRCVWASEVQITSFSYNRTQK